MGPTCEKPISNNDQRGQPVSQAGHCGGEGKRRKWEMDSMNPTLKTVLKGSRPDLSTRYKASPGTEHANPPLRMLFLV